MDKPEARGEARLAFHGGRLRFFDATGRAWTVYDVRRIGGRLRRVALAAEIATWRVFVSPEGKRHAYRFQRGESRDLDPAYLSQQLTSALWAGAFRPTRRSRR